MISQVYINSLVVVKSNNVRNAKGFVSKNFQLQIHLVQKHFIKIVPFEILQTKLYVA